MAKLKKHSILFVILIVWTGQLIGAALDSNILTLLPSIVQSCDEIIQTVPQTVYANNDSVALFQHLNTLAVAGKQYNVLVKGAGFKVSLTRNHNYTTIPSLSVDSLATIQKALDYVAGGIGNNLDVRRALKQKVGDEQGKQILTPFNELEKIEKSGALKKNMHILANFERKYGPESAKLNLVEALINCYLLRSFGAFSMQSDGNPGPWEVILAYTTSYFGYDEKAVESNNLLLVSAAEAGLRYYVFSNNWGRLDMIRPNYISFGMLIAGENNGFFRNPFEGEKRYGAFLGWGDVKAAYLLTGDDKRFLVNRQFQLIPTLF